MPKFRVRLGMPRCWEWEADQPSIEHIPVLIAFLGYDSEDAPVTLGDHLRARRRALGITQRALALRLGVSHDSVGGWEAGKHSPTDARTRHVFACELGCGVARQLGLVDALDLAVLDLRLTLSGLITRALQASRLSVRKIATRVGVHEETLRRWKGGKRGWR